MINPVDYSISIFRDGFWPKKSTEDHFHSFLLPLFLEKLVVDPKKFYDSLEWSINKESMADQFDGKVDDEIDHLNNTLRKAVIASFACVENAQYFGRMSAREEVIELFKMFAKKFEKLSVEILKRFKENDLSESEILEHLCLLSSKYQSEEKNGKFEPLDDGSHSWKKCNIIDISRMAKMEKFITNPIIQADLNSTFNGAFLAQSGTKRNLAFFVSLMSRVRLLIL